MKKKMLAVMMGVLLSAVALSGCEGKETTGSGRGTLTEAGTTPAAGGEDPDNPGEAGPTPTPGQQAEDDVVYVDSIPDLIQAIKPDAKIVLKAGEYSISEYIQDVWNNDPDLWNKNHKYAEIREVYDGVELVIRDVDGLDIKGESDNCADVEIVTDPRYAAVMSFEGCDKLILSGMTMGHTDRGECWGSVIDLVDCDSVILNNMDLYGCGVIGLNLEYCSNFLRCTDVTIRECSQGPLSNSNSRGEWKFYNCNLVGSESGGFFSSSNGLSLYFENCTFGDKETENFMFRDDTTTKNCTWGDVNTYPDYSEYVSEAPEAVDVNNLKVTAFDGDMLQYREWTGFEIVDDATGEIEETGQRVYFYSDGTGAMYDDISESGFSWAVDSQYSAMITMDNNQGQFGVTIYLDKNDPLSPMFMVLSMNGKSFWYYS